MLLAGEAVALDHTGDFAGADPNTYFCTNPIPLPNRRKKKVRKRSTFHYLGTVPLTLCGSFFFCNFTEVHCRTTELQTVQEHRDREGLRL